MRVLLLSAYDAVSHRMWREGLVSAFPEYEWHVHTLPPRHFSWRIRGNPLDFVYSQSLNKRDYDLIVASSMVDLAVVKGLCPRLAQTPSLVFFHENQFAYPVSKQAKSSIEPAMVNLYSALAADRVCFNSSYNHNTFFEGLQSLFKKLPDHAPLDVLTLLKAKSQVLPVPLQDDVWGCQANSERSASIVWNHRWEYDKGPDRFYQILQALPENLDIQVHVLGQTFTNIPSCMGQIQSLLIERGWMGQWGPIENRQEYLELLGSSQLVLSTALHDFQGLSVLEATAMGCIPIVPNRLAYPEFIPDEYRYQSCDSQAKYAESEEIDAASKMITQFVETPPKQMTSLNKLSWQNLKASYQQNFEACLDLHRRG